MVLLITVIDIIKKIILNEMSTVPIVPTFLLISSNMFCWNSNPQPLDSESPSLTTRPGGSRLSRVCVKAIMVWRL